MKTQNNTTAFQIVAAVTLLISTILLLISGYQSFNLLCMLGVGLLIAGILLANRKFMAIGALVNLAERLYASITSYSFLGGMYGEPRFDPVQGIFVYDTMPVGDIVNLFIPALVWLLFAIAIWKKDKALVLCGIAAALNVIPNLFYILRGGWIHGMIVAQDMLLCVSIGLWGYVLQNGIQSVFVSRPVETPKTASNQYENLIKLKDLLDSGAITQEEFDQKKKELLEV